MLTSLALVVIYIVLGFPAALVCVPVVLLTGDISLMYAWGMGITRLGLRVMGLRPTLHGLEHVEPGGQYLFLSNHLSNLDPLMLLPEIPVRIAVFIKRPLMKIPILGYCMGLAGFIPVDRRGDVEAARASVRRAQQVMDSGVSVVSFVEGTRSPDGRMLPFKKGPFYLAMESKQPIIPVSIHGTETMMRKGSLAIRRGRAHITFHAPLEPSHYPDRDALMAAVRTAIASGLPEWMRG
ncbi:MULTISPECIES: lysophospholipid acyltransferase family protein [Acidobacterium]|uniref:1-acyl-sn-glycerol-3-phosphate acyltransferase family protein n=1 Tax=Acidobacterium capsulatum (strain ATCC 51196 / DSM 11244 / BCRC 80197 / JCM 7670 / NBRC 15755 / NCIMB 13165 / 161) TaxID=240015 RepID=C1F6D2_ACIC5|nr:MULTISPECIES: lysophospholipid acyltransferase family protein [Acidobacterium]ACO33280.1 1-acyl-sn-glycerol-3-phosphate acyltransferase family protein [Acidobacterium capsulatum ATCC 51196]HCT60723.1 1-acyl-sn-glycerol-3-phosphate acyltransferase [Acidobacterium sp.]